MLAAILANGRYTVLAGQPTQGTELQTQFFVLPSEAAVELAIARWHPGALGDADGIESAAAQGVIPDRQLNPQQDWLAQVPNEAPAEAAGEAVEPKQVNKKKGKAKKRHLNEVHGECAPPGAFITT